MIYEEDLTKEQNEFIDALEDSADAARLKEILEIKRSSMIIANRANTFEGLTEIIRAAKRERSNTPAISTIKTIIRDAKFYSTYYDAEIKLIRTDKYVLCGYVVGLPTGDD